MHARLFENYENGMILAQASKQASKQTYKSVIFACNETESYRETRTSFVWHLAE